MIWVLLILFLLMPCGVVVQQNVILLPPENEDE
jgi:hypothetical protein